MRHSRWLLPIRPVDVAAAELLSEMAMGDPTSHIATLWGLEPMEINGQATSEFAFAFFGDAGSARGWYAEEGDVYQVYLVDLNGQTIAVKYLSHEPEFADFQTEVEELVQHMEFS